MTTTAELAAEIATVELALAECARAAARILEVHNLQNDTQTGRSLVVAMGWALRASEALRDSMQVPRDVDAAKARVDARASKAFAEGLPR